MDDGAVIEPPSRQLRSSDCQAKSSFVLFGSGPSIPLVVTSPSNEHSAADSKVYNDNPSFAKSMSFFISSIL